MVEEDLEELPRYPGDRRGSLNERARRHMASAGLEPINLEAPENPDFELQDEAPDDDEFNHAKLVQAIARRREGAKRPPPKEVLLSCVAAFEAMDTAIGSVGAGK